MINDTPDTKLITTTNSTAIQFNEQIYLFNLTQIIYDKHYNHWILNGEKCSFTVSMTSLSGRLGITIKDIYQFNFPKNIYSCSWSYNELVKKNEYLSKFEDIEEIEQILKMLIEDINLVSVQLPKEPNHLDIIFTFIKENNSKLRLSLNLLEKFPEVEEIEKNELKNYSRKLVQDLEQKYFDFSLQVRKMLHHNGIKPVGDIFPSEIYQRCRDRWVIEHPQEKFPMFDEKETFAELLESSQAKEMMKNIQK